MIFLHIWQGFCINWSTNKFDENKFINKHQNKNQMGGYIAKLLNSFSDMKAKILMLGLDGAGKTTVLYQMKLHENVHSVPTIGFNVE